jgi:hypothetical protein
MNRNQKIVYCFIYDDAKQFYRASQTADGTWNVTHSGQMYPLTHNPRNLKDSPVEFATNKRYFSMNRSINYPLEFILDGAAILNSRYLLGKGVNENLYYAMFEFDSNNGGKYKLSYNGKFDFQSKHMDDKTFIFTVPLIDDSAWGILSQNDDTEFAIDCSENNPDTIKVLFDDFTLPNRYTFETVQSPLVRNSTGGLFVNPFVLVNQDGDSFGIVAKSQTGQIIVGPFLTVDLSLEKNYFFYTFYRLTGVNIQGRYSFSWTGLIPNSPALQIFFRTTKNQIVMIFQARFAYGLPGPAPPLIPGKVYDIDFNFDIDLDPGEAIFFFDGLQDSPANLFTVTPIVTKIFVTTKTKAESTICLGLRPLDAIKALVNRATRGRYTIDSDYFANIDNRAILIPGDSLRGVSDAKIYTSFRDFFESFSALFFMALRVVNGSLFMELADEVYKQGTNIIDLGDLIECETSSANDYYANEIEVGSPKQDYRHPSGRLEFNCTFGFSMPFTNLKNKISWVSKYRTDCYGIIFMLLDYKGNSTQDDRGDKTVFLVDITDEQGSAVDQVETFETVTVDNAVLAPIIKYPLTGDVINNNKPFLRGIGIIGTTVNVFVNGVLDGSTVVDGSGNWSYQIVTALASYNPGVADGVNVIEVGNTTITGALDTIQLVIDTTVTAPTGIVYPKANDSLYNNLPLLRGTAPPGTNININLDGVFLVTVIADNSCKWEYKIVIPISNGSHTLDIGGTVTNFEVNSFVDFPLITYIGSELDGFIIVNNLPLIRGVAKPGTLVTLWLDYISYAPLGDTILTDANGDWSYQVVPRTYLDPITGLPVTLAPISNGLHIISTLLVNNSVNINVSGFKLNRPLYDSITGVPDNTVFNTRFTPKRMLMNHKSMLSAIMNKQSSDYIHFENADKNSTLVTVLGTETIEERADVSGSSLGDPIARLENAKIKVISRKSFNEILYDFNAGGTIKAKFKGNDIFFLPIGSMKMKSIMDDIQEWNLLISPETSYGQLLNLYKNGLTIDLMNNRIFRSDANALHFVTYNYTQPDKYNFKEIYDDWFDNRNEAWLFGETKYIQKFQLSDHPIVDQIISRGLGTIRLDLYTCKDAKLVDSIEYNPATPAPIPIPEVVMEAIIDLSLYPADQYFFTMVVGADTIVAISERIETRTKWKRTVLIESSNSINTPGAFYSTGFKTVVRVEGLIKKIQPKIDTVIATEESGNAETIYSLLMKKRIVRLGTARGFPDYMAIKCAGAVINDQCLIEGVHYTIVDGEKINPSEDISGVPMYHYDINMVMSDNSQGVVFAGADGEDTTGVVLVVDASAIGLPPDVLINISEG